MKYWFERGAWVSSRGKKVLSGLRREHIFSIAVIRHAALGDMVLVRPFLVELRKFFANAEITLSIVSNYEYGTPYDLIDRLHILHGSNDRNVSMLQRIRRAKQLGSIDLLFDLADTTRSRYLTALTGARFKVGFPYRGYLRRLLYDAAVWRSDFSFEAINMLDMLMLIGANPTIPPDFGWSFGPKLIEGERMVYFPFASTANKCWDQSYFVSLIESMARLYPNHKHVILGGVGENEALDSFIGIEQSHQNVQLQSKMDLDALTGFLWKSSLVIANDTGVRNLAIATGTPTVGIFFSTVPYRYWPRYGRHEAVFKDSGDQPQVTAVIDAIQKILGDKFNDL